MKKALTFDDVALVPQYNNIKSRVDSTIDLSTWLTKKTKIGMPLLAANMDSVMSEELADVLIKNGGKALFHRFTNQDAIYNWAEKYNQNCFISIGVNVKDEDLKVFCDKGVKGVVIDIAHAHSETIRDLLLHIKKNYKDLEIIAGNVCTAGGYIDLVNWGADAVKVGIGPGSACTTRIKTGFGVPQLTAIMDCAAQAKKYSVPIIADGGIRGSADIAKALAAGATTAMMGKIFAFTYESAAKKYYKDDNGVYQEYTDNKYDLTKPLYAKYRGQASFDFQLDFKGGLKEGTVPEGVHFYNQIKKSTQEVIDELLGGLRSSLTYGGARTIGELQRKAEFVEVTSSYYTESNPREFEYS